MKTDRETVIHRTRSQAAGMDVGLRDYMLKVFNYMSVGLAITGIVAFFVASTPALYEPIFGTGFRWVVMFAPLIFVLVFSARVHHMSVSMAQSLFWLFAVVMGLSMSTIFLAYTSASIARVFFITAATFAAMSLYGYTTQRDLSSWGSFLFMGLIGVFMASLVNLFIQSSAFYFVVSIVGVIVFTGLTAYDVQNIKLSYYELEGRDVSAKRAIIGALGLYLDFINLFIMLLRLTGERR